MLTLLASPFIYPRKLSSLDALNGLKSVPTDALPCCLPSVLRRGWRDVYTVACNRQHRPEVGCTIERWDSTECLSSTFREQNNLACQSMLNDTPAMSRREGGPLSIGSIWGLYTQPIIV